MRTGTSSLVVAAFVGPGTVLTCASAGAGYGFTLAWVLLFAGLAVFVLQSFTAASGILAGRGLGTALRESIRTPVLWRLIQGVVVLGLWVGCAAFQTGNLLGASAGIEIVAGISTRTGILVCSLAAAAILLFDVRVITRLLGGLVALMSVLFVWSALRAGIEWSALGAGIVVPQIPEGSAVTALALMGTTVVTYNLFLHPSASRTYWQGSEPRSSWRRELLGMAVFVPLGAVVSLAILAAAAGVGAGARPWSIAEFAVLLEPAAGASAKYLFAAGLLAAGLTSAVTAPLAAAAGVSELFGWEVSSRHPRFRLVWASVVATGVFFGLTGYSPLQLIIAAQAANGLLLPGIAGLAVYVAAFRSGLRLPRWYLALGILVVVVCAGLGVRTLIWVAGQI